jgi:hypothetical protein
MSRNSPKEKYDMRRKRIRATLIEFGINGELAKTIDGEHPVGVLERIIEATKKRQPEDKANYFLKGLNYSRVKHGRPPLFHSFKEE